MIKQEEEDLMKSTERERDACPVYYHESLLENEEP